MGHASLTKHNTHGTLVQYTLHAFHNTHFCLPKSCWLAAWTQFLTKYLEFALSFHSLPLSFLLISSIILLFPLFPSLSYQFHSPVFYSPLLSSLLFPSFLFSQPLSTLRASLCCVLHNTVNTLHYITLHHDLFAMKKIPKDLNHWKSRTKMIFLRLVLRCKYIWILGLEFFQRCGHHIMPISCKAS